MLKNNIEMDVKMRCIEKSTTQAKIAENIGTSPSYVNKIVRCKEQIRAMHRMAEDKLLLTEVWRDAEAIEVHKNSEHFAKLGELKAEYVENTEFMKFSAEQV